jgi:hypothetical protein
MRTPEGWATVRRGAPTDRKRIMLMAEERAEIEGGLLKFVEGAWSSLLHPLPPHT